MALLAKLRVGSFSNVVVACVVLAAPVPAQQVNEADPFVFESLNIAYIFNDDGTGTRTDSIRVRLNSDTAAQDFGQLLFPYLKGRESITVDRIAVFDAGGKLLHDGAAEVRDLPAPVTTQFPFYSDLNIVHIMAPPLARGNVLEVSKTTEIVAPEAPGHFWMSHTFTTLVPVRSEELTVTFPAAREVRVKAGIDPEIDDQDGRRTYRWSHSSEGEQSEEDEDASPYVASPPDVQLSSFLSWREVGAWATSLMDGRAVADKSVRQKVEELVAGADSPLEKVERIYSFVTREFRYLSISYGVGRYQPHAASEVLASGYGDCKDKHTLLAAMLNAVGVAAHPVLIGSGIGLEPEVPSPAQFNHVITRVSADEDALWVDGTVQVTPFRYLNPYLLAKQALLVDGADSRLVTTPARTPVPERMSHEVRGSVDADGTLSAQVAIELRGRREYDWRIALAQTPKASWNKVVFDSLEPSTGEITNLSVSELTQTDDPLHITYDLTIESFLSPLTQEQSVKLPLPRFRLASDEDIDREWFRDLWAPHVQESSIKLGVPSDFELNLPVPVESSWEFGSYVATYELDEDGKLIARRKLAMDVLPEPDGALGVLRSAVTDDVRQQVAASLAGDLNERLAEADVKGLESAAAAAWKQDDYASAAGLYRRLVELEPEHESGWYRLGYSLSKQGRYEDGVAAFRKHREIEPYHERVGRMIAWALVESGDTEAAIEEYRAQLELFPLDDYALAQLGRILKEEDRCDEAVPLLQKAASIDGEDTRSRLRMGQCQLQLGNDDEALKAFAKLRATTDDDWELNAAGNALIGEGHPEEAIPLLEKAIGIDPEDKAAFNNLGRALIELGRYEEALEPLRRQTEINPEDRWAFNNLGRAMNALGRYEEALEPLRRQLEINSEDKWAHMHLGRALAELGDLEAAWASFERHLEVDPDDDHDRAHIFEIYAEHDEWERGLAALEPAVESSSYATFLVVEAAQSRARARPQTEAVLRRLAENSPHATLAKFALAGAVGVTQGLDAGATVLQEIVDQYPNHPSALSLLGVALFHLDRHEESREFLIRALEQNSEDVSAHRGLGLLAAGREDYGTAIYHLGVAQAAMGEHFPDQDLLDHVASEVPEGEEVTIGPERGCYAHEGSPETLLCVKDSDAPGGFRCQPESEAS